MNRVLALALISAIAGGCASASPERAVLDAAAMALGGADRLLALKALTIEGSGSAPNAGQNRMPDDELPVWKVTEFKRTLDLANGRTRDAAAATGAIPVRGRDDAAAEAGPRRRRRIQRRA